MTDIKEILIFRNSVGVFNRVLSMAFFVGFLIYIYNLSFLLKNLSPFWLIFLGSLVMIGIYWPWTQQKEIEVHNTKIISRERLGLGLKPKIFEVPFCDVEGFNLNKTVLTIKSVGGAKLLNLKNIVHYQTIQRLNRIKINNKVSPFRFVKILEDRLKQYR